MVWRPEEEKLTDFVFRFSQLAYELDYSDEQQISHFVLCIPRGLYLYLEGTQTVPDAVENLRKGIALGGLDTFSSIPRIVHHNSKPTVPCQTKKENRTQFTTEDTLRFVKKSIQDSRSDNPVRLLDKIGDRLADVADVVEHFQRKQSSRNRDRSDTRDRDHSKITTGIELEIEGTVKTTTGIKVEMTAEIEIDIEIGLTQEMKKIEEGINKDLEQVKDTWTRMTS